MRSTLVFPDPQGYADFATLVRRAKQADPDAAVRLHTSGGVLRVWVGVLPGSGLLADGAAVGVRGIALADPAAGPTAASSTTHGSASDPTTAGSTTEGSTTEGSTTEGSTTEGSTRDGSTTVSSADGGSTDTDPTDTCSIDTTWTHLDLVCSASALLDRFARDGVGATSVTLPTVGTYAAWSGALPGTRGWTTAGEVSAADLIAAATAGIAEIAEGVGSAGPVAGARAVEELRRRVWARPISARAGGTTGSDIDGHAEAGAVTLARGDVPAGADAASGGACVDGPVEAGAASGRTVDVPAGAAFAAYVLGFVPDPAATVRVWRSGRWVRLQTPGGHVLARP